MSAVDGKISPPERDCFANPQAVQCGYKEQDIGSVITISTDHQQAAKFRLGECEKRHFEPAFSR